MDEHVCGFVFVCLIGTRVSRFDTSIPMCVCEEERKKKEEEKEEEKAIGLSL